MMTGLHMFGGSWADRKLDLLHKYFHAYMHELRHHPIQILYIDAFAGTRYRELDPSGNESQSDPIPRDPETKAFLDGSVKMSFHLDRPFDHYFFLEQDKARCDQITAISKDFPLVMDRIFMKDDDFNYELRKFCAESITRDKDWRAVLFLDPIGMNAQWETMEAIAKEELIDVWVLFPLDHAVHRLLMGDGERVTDGWSKRLDAIFGTHQWADRLEAQGTDPKAGNLKVLADFYQERLKTIFPAMAENPQVMTNPKSNPIFMFCFAVGNSADHEQALALRLADKILDHL